MICTIVIPVIMEIHFCSMMVYICLYNMLNCYHSHYDDILPGLQGEMMLRSAEKAPDQRWPPEEPKDEILEDAVEEP